jgi:HD-GYP domain-containing protein (c-di-GMP phosphodiesterase class II)
MFPLVKSAIQQRKQRKLLKGAFFDLVKAIDLRDASSETHSDRVAVIAARIARAMHLPTPEVEEIRTGASLHDVGMIGFPAASY